MKTKQIKQRGGDTMKRTIVLMIELALIVSIGFFSIGVYQNIKQEVILINDHYQKLFDTVKR